MNPIVVMCEPLSGRGIVAARGAASSGQTLGRWRGHAVVQAVMCEACSAPDWRFTSLPFLNITIVGMLRIA